MSFRMGKKLRYISIHDICNVMSPVKVYALPAFHAGCDNTSFFSGRKDICLWKLEHKARSHNNIMHLMERPITISSEDIKIIESFVVSLYSVTYPLTEVNQTRQQIFAQSSRTFEYLLPTKAAIIEHIKSATYQAGYVWGQSPVTEQVLPSPGWVESESGWVSFWTPLPRAAKALEELVSCGCTKTCAGKCSCYKRSLVCTARCKCAGKYYKDTNWQLTP